MRSLHDRIVLDVAEPVVIAARPFELNDCDGRAVVVAEDKAVVEEGEVGDLVAFFRPLPCIARSLEMYGRNASASPISQRLCSK